MEVSRSRSVEDIIRSRCVFYETLRKLLEYRKIISEGNATSSTWFSLGNSQIKDAINGFKTAWDIGKNNFAALVNLAVLYESDNDLAEALHFYTVASCLFDQFSERSTDITRDFLHDKVCTVKNKLKTGEPPAKRQKSGPVEVKLFLDFSNDGKSAGEQQQQQQQLPIASTSSSCRRQQSVPPEPIPVIDLELIKVESPSCRIKNSSELLKMCMEDCKNGVTKADILNEMDAPPVPPKKPEVVPNNGQLHPPTPTFIVKNKKMASSPDLKQYCYKYPITLVTGLMSARGIDLTVFNIQTLLQTPRARNHFVEVRNQRYQSGPENRNEETGEPDWNYISVQGSASTLKKYATYQAAQTREHEKRWKLHASNKSSLTAVYKQLGNEIMFGTNIDLSDNQLWEAQLDELTKLPDFLQVDSSTNMLSYAKQTIKGMNTIQYYAKVPGCRTPAHQENNNFCSVNINIGPGNCEWFAISGEYWGAVKTICDEKNINFLKGSWWPHLPDCENAGIPVYQFIQEPGDLVWVNPACVHWVQALETCDNVAWNVGPFTNEQYQSAMERFLWNKTEKYTSIIPMLHLSWNLASEARPEITDDRLYTAIRKVLEKSIIECHKVLTFASEKKVSVEMYSRRNENELVYCENCMAPIFNLVFAKRFRKKKENVGYCAKCALEADPTNELKLFRIYQEYEMKDLARKYDNFVMN